MDLCLPDDWLQREAGVFRDDLGPHPASEKSAPRRAVCGLRDWRAVNGHPVVQHRRSSTLPPLKPYRAPDWLRLDRPVVGRGAGVDQRGANTASSSTSSSRRQISPCK